jgi:hypothetical protein
MMKQQLSPVTPAAFCSNIKHEAELGSERNGYYGSTQSDTKNTV